MAFKFRSLLGVVLAGAAFFGAASASAIVVEENCKSLSGGSVTINECNSYGYYNNNFTGSYSVLNNSSSYITSFMVSTGSVNTGTGNSRGWNSQYIGKKDWSGLSYSAIYGSFESLFGEEDLGAFHYYQGEGGGAAIAAGEDTGKQFFFDAIAASEFVAFGGSGQIVAQSFIAPLADVQVPEPGSLALLGLGFAGLALARRKTNVK